MNCDALSQIERAALDLVRRQAVTLADLLAEEAGRAWGRYPTLAASYWRSSATLMRLAAEQAAEDRDFDVGGVPYATHCRSVAAMRETLAAEAIASADERAGGL